MPNVATYNFKMRLGNEICSFDVNTHKGRSLVIGS